MLHVAEQTRSLQAELHDWRAKGSIVFASDRVDADRSDPGATSPVVESGEHLQDLSTPYEKPCAAADGHGSGPQKDDLSCSSLDQAAASHRAFSAERSLSHKIGGVYDFRVPAAEPSLLPPCASCDRYRKELRSLRTEIDQLVGDVEAIREDRNQLRNVLAEYQAGEAEQGRWVEEEVKRRLSEERIVLLEAAREDHAVLQEMSARIEDREASALALRMRMDEDLTLCDERAAEVEKLRTDALALHGALESDRARLTEAEQMLVARDAELREWEAEIRKHLEEGARRGDELSERERLLARDQEAARHEASAQSASQAQRERALEARLAEVEAREDRSARREQALLDREREVAASEQEAALARYEGERLSASVRTAAEGARDKELASQRSADAVRHAEEQLREQIRTTDARLAAQARRLTDWEAKLKEQERCIKERGDELERQRVVAVTASEQVAARLAELGVQTRDAAVAREELAARERHADAVDRRLEARAAQLRAQEEAFLTQQGIADPEAEEQRRELGRLEAALESRSTELDMRASAVAACENKLERRRAELKEEVAEQNTRYQEAERRIARRIRRLETH